MSDKRTTDGKDEEMTPTPDDAAMPDEIIVYHDGYGIMITDFESQDADAFKTYRYTRADKPHAEAVRVLVEALRTYNRGGIHGYDARLALSHPAVVAAMSSEGDE